MQIPHNPPLAGLRAPVPLRASGQSALEYICRAPVAVDALVVAEIACDALAIVFLHLLIVLSDELNTSSWRTRHPRRPLPPPQSPLRLHLPQHRAPLRTS